MDWSIVPRVYGLATEYSIILIQGDTWILLAEKNLANDVQNEEHVIQITMLQLKL